MKTAEITITIKGRVRKTRSGLAIDLYGVEVVPSTIEISGEAEECVDQRMVARMGGKKGDMHDLIQEAAEALTNKGESEFTADDLYNWVLADNPYISKNTFRKNVISAAPDHASWHHYRPYTRDYLKYLGKGTYKLRHHKRKLTRCGE
jgi:hypothetical protein